MASFRLLSKWGDGLPIANTLQDEGHEVSAWIENDRDPKDKDSGSYKNLYDGIIEKVNNPTEGLSKDTIVIIDSTAIKHYNSPKEIKEIEKIEEKDTEQFIELPTWGDVLRGEGYQVIGGGRINDAMELDRKFGQDLALEAGFSIPIEKEFGDYNEALKFVRSTKKRYVLKPSGCQESYSVYPSRDWEDLSTQLQHLIDTGSKADKILLQEHVEGVQMGIEGTWTGEELVGFQSTFEHKRLLAGSTGPLTGETGSVVFYYPDANNKLCSLLKRIEPMLKQMAYPHGQLDANFIHNEEGSWFLEWTPRQGYPATYIQLYACTDWGKTYEGIAKGDLVDYYVKPAKFFGGVNVFIPEYPYGKTKKDYVESPTFFKKITSSLLDNITFVDVKIKNQAIVTGGTYGNIMCVTGEGDDPEEVHDGIEKVIKEIEVYPMGYRNDIGLNLDDDLQNLRSWGYWVPELQQSSK